MSSHAGAETAEAGESREEVIDPLVSGKGGCGVGGVGNYERYDGRWRSPAPALLPKTNQPAASTAPQLPKVAPKGSQLGQNTRFANNSASQRFLCLHQLHHYG